MHVLRSAGVSASNGTGVTLVQCRYLATNNSKPNPFAKKPKPTYEQVPRVGHEGSLVNLLHKVRLEHWSDEQAARESRPSLPKLPSDIPEDIEKQPKLWPSGKYVTGTVAYRKLWLDLDYPTYWTIVRTKDKNGSSVYYGVPTVRGITQPNIRKIPSARKRDWVILPKDQLPTCEVWQSLKQSAAQTSESTDAAEASSQ